MKTNTIPIKYCLYARKSSESDEKQAMSIDGQLMEMRELAKRDKIIVIEEVTESHSAKETGQRPQFNYMLDNLQKGKYNAIITWAPDRISRNAGDLGKIIDLMDQGKLLFIKTHSQTFSNNPNEKFLLMILCSQAKLENDNRGINVKRGHKNKCQIGIRPGPAPMGYINYMKSNRIASVGFDPERHEIVREMFMKVANEGYSGRMIRKWLRKINFKTKNDKSLSLGRIYATLKNPFYYGRFKFGNKFYKGTYEPLVTKQIFDKVQVQLQVAPRQWNKQMFPFKKICKCASCGASVTAEIKYRHLKLGGFNEHIYYHCNRIRDLECPEPYITETELIKQLIGYIPLLDLNNEYLWNEFKDEIKRFNHLTNIITKNKVDSVELTPNHRKKVEIVPTAIDNDKLIKDYLQHILLYGTPDERVRILGGVLSKFELSQRKLILK